MDSVEFKIPDLKIQYTYTDEAPMLATYSLLPVLRAFCRHGGVKIVKKDISVAARILARSHYTRLKLNIQFICQVSLQYQSSPGKMLFSFVF